MAGIATVLARADEIEVRNDHWLLRVGVDVSAEDACICGVASSRNASVRLRDGRLSFEVTIPPLSPLLVEVNTDDGLAPGGPLS